jgi:hypothetical protein
MNRPRALFESRLGPAYPSQYGNEQIFRFTPCHPPSRPAFFTTHLVNRTFLCQRNS